MSLTSIFEHAITAAGGNSRAARSARAKLQPRDRYGRWIETGRGVFGKMRFPDGTIKSVIGKAVGGVPNPANKSNPFVQMYVHDDPNGLPDGFYTLTPGNAQGNLVATLDASTIDDADVKAPANSSVGERADKDIPNSNDPAIFSNLPYGITDNGDGSYSYDKYTLQQDPNTGEFTVSKDGEAFFNGADDWADALAALDRDEDGEPQPPQKVDPATAEATPEASTPEAAEDSEANIPATGVDTDTFDVAKEGFLVPTGKRVEELTPESLADFVGQHKEALGKGGTRIVIDTDTQSAEIHNSADTRDNAIAQAGGIGTPEVIDLSTGESISTEEAKEAPENGEGSGTDAVEPERTESGATAPVESGDSSEGEPAAEQPAGGDAPAQPAAGADDPRVAELEKQLADLSERFANTENDRARDRIEQKISDIEAQLDEIQKAVTPAPEAEADTPDDLETKVEEQDDRISELEAEVSEYRAYADEARRRLEEAGENADSTLMEEDDAAQEFVREREAILEDTRERMAEIADSTLEELRAQLAGEEPTPEREAPKVPAAKPNKKADKLRAKIDKNERTAEDIAAEQDDEDGDSQEPEAVEAREKIARLEAENADLLKKVAEAEGQTPLDIPEDAAPETPATPLLDELGLEVGGPVSWNAIGNRERTGTVLGEARGQVFVRPDKPQRGEPRDFLVRPNRINAPEGAPSDNADTRGQGDLPEGVSGPDGDNGRADSGSSASRSDLGRKIDRPARWDALEAQGLATPDLYEMPSTPENAKKFHEGISKLKENNPYSASVYVYPEDEYEGMRLFMTEDGTAGVAIKDGDEMVSGFVHSDSPHKGAFRAILSAAIAEGGVRGDAFDTVLPELYAQEGFVPAARQKFNSEFAPEDWNYDTYKKYNNGRPDVVFLRYDESRVDSKYVPGEGQYVDDYDDGIALARGEQIGQALDMNEEPEIDAPVAPEQGVAEADLATGPRVLEEGEYEGNFRDPFPYVDLDGWRWDSPVSYVSEESDEDRFASDLSWNPRNEDAFRADNRNNYGREELDAEVERRTVSSDEGESSADRAALDAYNEQQWQTGYDAGMSGERWDETNFDPAYWEGYTRGAVEGGHAYGAAARERLNYLNAGGDPQGLYSPFLNPDWKAIKEFPGTPRTSRLDISDETKEPTNSAAVYELLKSERRPDAPSNETFPRTHGTADSVDGPEGTSPEDLQGATTGDSSGFDPDTYDFGYEDSDEDYANEKFMPTGEQRNIIKAVLGGKNVAVQALAGTGKTTTLELMARRIGEVDPKAKILYIAFNKSVQEEAQARMPSNVEARTGDSLGFTISRDITKKFNNKDAIRNPQDVAEYLGIPKRVDLGDGVVGDSRDVAMDLDKVITAFSISEDDNIGQAHFDAAELPMTDETLAWAEAYWADLNDKNGSLRIRNDHITKIWALSKPDLSKAGSGPKSPATIIFFDEAQDINPVMARVVREQSIQKIYVGDGRQAIYGFRGAENELDNVEVDVTLPLTQSWRFGPQVAGVGNRYLSLIDSPYKIVGGGPDGEIVDAHSMDDPDAILTRSNAGAVKSILAQLELGRTVGADAKFKSDLQALIQTVQYLKDRSRNKPRMHEDLAGYKTWSEVEDDVDNEKASAKVVMLKRLVDNQGIDALQHAVDNLRVVEKGDKPGSGEAPGTIDYTIGSNGIFEKGVNQWGRPANVNYEITKGERGPLRMTLTGNTFPIKDDLKAVGFRFDGAKKGWYIEGTPEKIDEVSADFRSTADAPIDVIVTTAHKAKGLEWGRVKIADDFRGPSTTVDPDTGEEFVEWPEPEELRLAYVAVTRAQNVLDPGSLSWVYQYTNDSDEDPNVPSNGLPGGERDEPTPMDQATPEPDEAPEPTPEPVAEPEPEAAPEAEPVQEPIPEVAPEPEPAPEVAPEPEAPAAPVAEEPEDDELPGTIEELEDLAGRLERQLAGARPARARVLQREIDAIYDRIEELEGDNAVPESAPEVTPEPEADWTEGLNPEDIVPVPQAAKKPEAQRDVERSVAKNVAAGKQTDDTPDFEDDNVLNEVMDRPNAANTVTKPREPEDINTELERANRDLLDAEDDPTRLVDPNLIWDDVKRTNPGFAQRPNGDLLIQSKQVGDRRYDLVVRRTTREKFYAVVVETDKDGNQRVMRLRTGRGKNNSYKGLLTQIDRGKKIMAKNAPKADFDRRRSNIEKLAPHETFGDGMFGGYIDGTDLPETQDAAYNAVVAAIATLVRDTDIADNVLETLATDRGFDAGMVKIVREAVVRRRFEDAVEAPSTDVPTHISYDNQPLEVGNWVDWTDVNKTIPLTDEFGNTVYETDPQGNFVLSRAGKKVPVQIPNPNYGRVYRGYVKGLDYKAGDKYVYSDNARVIFPEINSEKGWKASKQSPRIASKLRVVDGENAPKSAAFYPETHEEFAGQAQPPLLRPTDLVGPGKQDVAPERAVADDFDVPETGNETVERNEVVNYTEFAPFEASFNGVWPVHMDNPALRLPESDLDIAITFQNAREIEGTRHDLQPGDFLPASPSGEVEFVVSLSDGPKETSVTTVTMIDGEYYDRIRALRGDNRLTFFRPSADDMLVARANDIEEAKLHMNQMMLGREMTPQMRKTLQKAIGDANNLNELATIRQDIDAFKPKKAGKPRPGAVDNILKGLAEGRNADQKLSEKDDLGDIEEVQKALVQDNAALEGHKTDRFRGAGVAALDVKDFNPMVRDTQWNPDTAQFARAQMPWDKMRVGDVVETRAAVAGMQKSSYAQFISARPVDGNRDYIDVVLRRLDDSEDPTDTIHTGWGETRQAHLPGDQYTRREFVGSRMTVYRPTSNIDEGYFADSKNIPAPPRGPRQNADFGTLVADDPEMLKAQADETAKRAKSYDTGFIMEASRADAGALNTGAAVGRGQDGRPLFTKEVSSHHQFASEVMAMRVYNVLGGKDNYLTYTSDVDPSDTSKDLYRIVSDRVPGQSGSDLGWDKSDAEMLSERMAEREDVLRFALLDLIIANADRHAGNYMITDKEGRLVPIDNELSFELGAELYPYTAYSAKLLQMIREGNSPLTSAQLLRIRNNLGALKSEFNKMNMAQEFTAMMLRLNKLIDGVNGYVI